MSERMIAAVTGASGGVGRATAIELAARGFDVALVARGEAGLQAAAKDVEGAGGTALICPLDVSDYAQVAEAAERIERDMGAIDVWVNDAMTTVFAPIDDIEPADYRRAVEVTFLGQVWGTKVALSHMRPRDRGTIVNVGSALAFMGIPLQSAYCAAKFACRGFFESVRAELIHEGSNVRLCMVHLPGVNTPQFEWCKNLMDGHAQPVAPIYQPEVPARYIAQVALDGRRSKIVGSWNKLLIAGARAAPGFANQYAAIAAWESQLTENPEGDVQAANLYQPVDDEVDHGSHGRFDRRAGGVLDPSFLTTVPGMAKQVGRAAAETIREKCRRYAGVR